MGDLPTVDRNVKYLFTGYIDKQNCPQGPIKGVIDFKIVASSIVEVLTEVAKIAGLNEEQAAEQIEILRFEPKEN